MSLTLDQRQLETLSQLLTAGGHQDVVSLLTDSLGRLVAFWPAQAGALIYQTPHGELVRLESGPLDSAAATLIEQARSGFIRHTDNTKPSVGYYTLEDGRDILELPLQSSGKDVGLLHLVTNESSDKSSNTPLKDEDLLLLLVRAIGESLTANLDLASLLDEIKLHAPEVVGAERCSIFMLDEERNELVLDMLDDERSFRMPADRGIAGWVATHGVGQIVHDVEQDPRWYDVVGREFDFVTQSILCVPMKVKDRVVGVVQLLNKRDGARFTDQDLRLLTTLASQAGIAIENARL